MNARGLKGDVLGMDAPTANRRREKSPDSCCWLRLFMFDNRSLRGDISLVALIALIIFLVVSLVTYHPADPTAQLAPPP